MKVLSRGAAIMAALLLCQGAVAQDVTLTSRDGSLSLTGTLQGYDGEFFRIDTNYGPLTVDGQGVTCDGPGCPDLTAPKAVIRFVGAQDAGNSLLPTLFAAFAEARGLNLGVLPWTVNCPADMRRLIGWGVDGLITDRPDLAMLVLRDHGAGA